MKSIIKIEEYIPETNRIVVKIARLHAPRPIDDYQPVTVDCDKLDCYNTETFLHTLMRVAGERHINVEEDLEPIVNKVDTVSEELDLPNMVGKVIQAKIDNNRKEILRMRRVEL